MTTASRLRHFRAGSVLTLAVASVSLAVAMATLGMAIHRAKDAYPQRMRPVAAMQWQSTLEQAFQDIAALPLDTLPERGNGFALRDGVDDSAVATRPAEPRG